MTILYKTNELTLEYKHETTWLKENSTGKIIMNDEFYGDPECGLIDANNNWAIIAGDHLTIWIRKNNS